MLVEKNKKSGITFKPRLCELHVIRCQQQRDLEQSSLPKWCIRYPPGSTVLECRFENDRPLARVVQMPADSVEKSEGLYGEISSKAAKKLRRLARGQKVKDKVPPIIIILKKGTKDEEGDDEQDDVVYRPILDEITDSPDEISDALAVPKDCIATPKVEPKKDTEFQLIEVPRSPPDCETTCEGSRPIQKAPEPVERKPSCQSFKKRNGLEPVEVKTSTYAIPKRPKRICPIYCCKLERKLEREPPPFPGPPPVSLPTKKEKRKKSEPETKSAEKPKAEDCLKSKVKGAQPKKRWYDTVSITSDEVLTNYRHLIPESLLAKYLSCSSKRNGLQDECILPIPRAVIEAKKAEECAGKEGTGGKDTGKFCDPKKEKEQKLAELQMKKQNNMQSCC